MKLLVSAVCFPQNRHSCLVEFHCDLRVNTRGNSVSEYPSFCNTINSSPETGKAVTASFNSVSLYSFLLSGIIIIPHNKINTTERNTSMLSGPLSPRHGASSGCGWRNGLQVWRVAANTLNKQSRTADEGWSSSLGVGRGANNFSP
jgi:hypothetical protein